MRDPQTTAEFWDQEHTKGELLYLSGYSAEGELRKLLATKLIRPGARVLNIGVGLGFTTEYLIEVGCKVSIHDISRVALNKYAGRVAGAYLPADLPRLPDGYFDVALSHLVMQHMNDEALVTQIRRVIPSLAPGGVFAFQFAVSWDQKAPSLRFVQDISEPMPYCRSLAWMAGVVEDAGGMIVRAEISGIFPEFQFGWYTCHAIRRDAFPSYTL